MPAGARVKTLVVLDELNSRMRATAARLAKLARGACAPPALPSGGDEADETPARAAKALRGACALLPGVPELGGAVEELAGTLARLEIAPRVSEETAAELLLARVALASGGDEGSASRAGKWAKHIARAGAGVRPLGAYALAKYAELSGDSGAASEVARSLGPRGAGGAEDANPAPSGDALEELTTARALVALAGSRGPDADAALAAARETHRRLVPPFPAAPGAEGDPAAEAGSAPPATAERIGLSCDLWRAEGRVGYLQAAESWLLNRALFEQTEDGAGVVGRTAEGEPGRADDGSGTPALGRSLAEARGLVLTRGHDGALVAGMPANALAVVCIGEARDVRCLVSTQLPVRGWTRWTFEPERDEKFAPSAVTTRRTGRRQRLAPSLGPLEKRGETTDSPQLFRFLVRVPKWAQEKAPQVRVDRQKAKVSQSGGFLEFEVSTDSVTEIEVVFGAAPGLVERQSPASWAREVALTCGPLVLTASGAVNPGEAVRLPLRITSELSEIEVVADIRRRLPVLRAKALSGSRVRPVLFSPLSEVGGFSQGLGKGSAVACAPFRTWHRRGR